MKAAEAVVAGLLILIAMSGSHLRAVTVRNAQGMVGDQKAREQEQRGERGDPGGQFGPG